VYSNARVSLVEVAAGDWQSPDPLDFPKYYPTLLTLGLSAEDRNRLATAQPVAPLVPYDVIQWLREQVPPQRVLLSRPERIYLFAEFLDIYVAHAGFDLATPLDTEYLTQWVPQSSGHPFFGAPPDRTREAEFLRHWAVDYILVDPDHQSSTGHQLETQPERFQRLAEHNGYSLFGVRISRQMN
jgi:hypothetical protein